ncbi:hypothetical protein TELCIR_19772 [Teladorsagia circumcincta]|uniref:Suppressor of white apricot N-terminal domain-containing protein n=1 Tax=Teladorsagia circumcincta TaxID=45464 RepID=A0A2G9TLG8_TELCI|nr:hypothetical protein TELCIR_19772 [Teladorsagia circumcincta]
MWHEARRQEKQLRARIVDCSKRAEKRRRFYDSVRKDPDQFMQLHGRKCIIHTEKSIAKAAEDCNVLKSAESKATIGFNYENSVVVKKESGDTEASDDDTDIDQPEDIGKYPSYISQICAWS